MKTSYIEGFGEGIIKSASYKGEDQKVRQFEKILEDAKGRRDRERLEEACRELESLFISTIFKRMRATVPRGGLIRESLGEQVFRSMLDDELAREASKTGEFGLARLLYRQLSQKLDK